MVRSVKKERLILVTSAIIKKGRKYLITQRPDDGRANSGQWEFPGGKVEFGEHPARCFKREILEELGIEIKVMKLFGVSSYVYKDGRHIILLGFHCKHVSGEIQNKDIVNWKYVSPGKMRKYDLSSTDLAFVRKLQNSR